MKHKKIAILGTTLSSAAIVGVIGFSSVSAATTHGHDGLATKIAQTFHLQPSAVQTVISQYRTQNEQQRYQKHLDAAVSHNKITASQEQQILAERSSVQTYIKSLKGQPKAVRRADIKKEFQQVKAWAKTNHIPFGLLMSIHRH